MCPADRRITTHKTPRTFYLTSPNPYPSTSLPSPKLVAVVVVVLMVVDVSVERGGTGGDDGPSVGRDGGGEEFVSTPNLYQVPQVNKGFTTGFTTRTCPRNHPVVNQAC
ncbi:hypothetical protein E2C01_055603 [Portunus trituberculatus]|uniref:Uncharacterized protein n=1 Tax=Portunus trituberculatus TaxID=210409 RepID=A0A5B7GMX5_PORTR|nr:hypothetical protein [Portunus trituberculatus]